eukprot:6200971-Pleurochrysis_carterae.AAC.6
MAKEDVSLLAKVSAARNGSIEAAASFMVEKSKAPNASADECAPSAEHARIGLQHARGRRAPLLQLTAFSVSNSSLFHSIRSYDLDDSSETCLFKKTSYRCTICVFPRTPNMLARPRCLRTCSHACVTLNMLASQCSSANSFLALFLCLAPSPLPKRSPCACVQALGRDADRQLRKPTPSMLHFVQEPLRGDQLVERGCSSPAVDSCAFATLALALRASGLNIDGVASMETVLWARQIR